MALRRSIVAAFSRLPASGSSLLRNASAPSAHPIAVADCARPAHLFAFTPALRQWSSTTSEPTPSAVDFATLSANKAEYQKILDEVRHRIFGTHIGNGERSGRKVLRKALAAEKMADWYMPRLSQFDPVFADPKDELRKKKLQLLKRRGKGPPPKGQGKRAKKR